MPFILRGGFTLIELAIVLVIIGLIIGGIVVGRDLIHTAELRSVITQLEKYDTAVNTFKGKYNCLTGDCPHALAFGLGDSTCPDPYIYVPPNPVLYAGCNGNGNGRLDGNRDNPEHLSFWYHLQQAQLIEGKFDGKTDSASESPIFGVSAPYTRLRDVGIMTQVTEYLVGLDDASSGNVQMRSRELHWIDDKMDDGRPYSGKVRIHGNGSPPCTVPDNNYYLTGEYSKCSMRVRIAGF